ncbi:MAG: hypothetical protein GF355_15335 [Candidatus Eisenbacteria bacterium]|nr:hypothetical protein [Candidatus Eisenbacteria bacterium]
MSRDHPRWEEIVAFAEGLSEAGKETAEHIAACRLCAAAVSDLRELLPILREARLSPPPPETVGKTLAALRREWTAGASPGGSARRRAGRAGGRLREIWASVAADSLAPNHAVRASGRTASRSLIFRAEEFTVALSMSPGELAHLCDLMGHVMSNRESPEAPGGEARLCSHDRTWSAQIDAGGEFAFHDVDCDWQTLDLNLESVLLHVGFPGPSR